MKSYRLLFFLGEFNSSLVTSFPGPSVPWLVTFGHTQVCHWTFKHGAQHRTQTPQEGVWGNGGRWAGSGSAQPACTTAPTILPRMSTQLCWLEPKAAKFLISTSSLSSHFHFYFNTICCSLSNFPLCFWSLSGSVSGHLQGDHSEPRVFRFHSADVRSPGINMKKWKIKKLPPPKIKNSPGGYSMQPGLTPSSILLPCPLRTQ